MTRELFRVSNRVVRYSRQVPVTSVRVWKLGDWDHRVYATQEQADRLGGLLSPAPVVGFVDIVWDPNSAVDQHVVLGTETFEGASAEEASTLVMLVDIGKRSSMPAPGLPFAQEVEETE